MISHGQIGTGRCLKNRSWSLPFSRTTGHASFRTSCRYERDHVPASVVPGPRWLTETKQRIGKCVTFGLSAELVDEAGRILKILSNDWRNLIAGSEGYLTDKRRAGLHRHAISWGDQDSMQHVNNVMYVRYAETGRTNWARSIGQHFDVANRRRWMEMLSPQDIGLILKSIMVEYKFPMTWPDRISVYHKLRDEPTEHTQSLILDVVIMSEVKQRPAARCYEDVVVYDYGKGRKTTLAPFMLKQFHDIWKLQERAKVENLAQISDIEQAIRHLETQSWDRPDAKEDLGSAASR